MTMAMWPSVRGLDIRYAWLAAGLFAAAVVVHVVLFRILPFPTALLTLLLAFGAGVAASVVCMTMLIWKRQAGAGAALLVVAATAYAWQVLPTVEYSILVRFKLEQSGYEAAVRGQGCKVLGDCWSSSKLPGYVVFPYDGLGAFVAIVYAPDGDIGRFVATRNVFAGDADCVRKPITGKFFVCEMW